MNYLPLHLCKPEYGMGRVYKHKFIKFELVLMYSLHAIFRFAKIATVSHFICYTETFWQKSRFIEGDKRSPQTFLGQHYFINCITRFFQQSQDSSFVPIILGRKLAANALVLSARSVCTCWLALPYPWLLLVKIFQFYFTSVTRNSTSSDKSEADVALILPPFYHRCSEVLPVFWKYVETRI